MTTGIRVDLTPAQQRKYGSDHIVLTEQQARDVMGSVISASGGGRPKMAERCKCGEMTQRRAEARGHKC